MYSIYICVYVKVSYSPFYANISSQQVLANQISEINFSCGDFSRPMEQEIVSRSVVLVNALVVDLDVASNPNKVFSML